MDFDATAQVDQILANYEASSLIIWITLGAIVVALIALGTEFWVNLFGVIFSPSLTFQRILGEAWSSRCPRHRIMCGVFGFGWICCVIVQLISCFCAEVCFEDFFVSSFS